MSEVKVNKISPRTACGTVTLGDSGDTFTIPSGVTISNSGTAAGFGGTGEISWSTTVKTTGTFTATAGVGYFLNTGGGPITVNLPAGTAGDSVAMVDYAGTWQTSNVTITPNGSEQIGGGGAGVGSILNTEGQSVTFVYIDGTQGWVNVIDSTSDVRGNAYISATGGTITTSGNDKIHKFTGPGTFTVSNISTNCLTQNLISYTVVAGGGGGGGGWQSGGGGGGGFREVVSPTSPYTASPLNGYPTPGNRITVTATDYPITVGGGGAGATNPETAGVSGSDSTFSTITGTAGGGGGTFQPTVTPVTTGLAGGSGGGAGRTDGSTTGGAGNTPPVTPSQGFPGGDGANPYGAPYNGAGGGGATAQGPDVTGTATSPGGAGATTEITASPVVYAGGGGGGGSPTGAPGGPGGGGNGGSNTCGTNGTVNTGGGGGGSGGGSSDGGNGGDGIVIIRYRYQ